MIKECKKHGMVKHFKRNNTNSYRCKKCDSESVIKRTKNKIDNLIKYKGDKCQNCGYDKCNNALEFHHINPEKKIFSINSKKSLSLEKLKVEADKCVLLCTNCHREVHDEILLIEQEGKNIKFKYIEGVE